MRVLLDTHAFVWSLLDQTRLSRRVVTLLEKSRTEVWVSAISAWEVVRLHEEGRLKLKTTPQAWLESAFVETPVQEAPINRTIAMESRRVKLPHQDPADRFIVATALAYDLTLVTADTVILAAGACKVLAAR